MTELSIGWVSLQVGFVWVEFGRNFPPFGGLLWVMGLSWQIAKTKAFYFFICLASQVLVSHSLSTRVIKYSVSTAIIIGFLANVNSTWIQVHVRYMLSPVRLSSVCFLSVMLVHPTQRIEIYGNVSTPFGTMAIHWHPCTENFTEIVPGEPRRRRS